LGGLKYLFGPVTFVDELMVNTYYVWLYLELTCDTGVTPFYWAITDYFTIALHTLLHTLRGQYGYLGMSLLKCKAVT
jgi:hypothetical protein